MNIFELFGTIAINNKDANSQIDDTSGRAGKLAQGLKAVGKVAGAAGKAIGAGLAAGATAMGKMMQSSISGYAEYEQLVGGVETLFKDSSGKVMEYANNAYKTAGMSANNYMSTVTGFSSSLLKSMGNDTAAAAERANMAIGDMADNANKYGTNITDIQNAYQGFAKQNFTMLDNLKLGYGGTKTEMQKLLKDAQAIKKAQGENVKYSIDSFADIVEAIHVVQEETGVAGTTAEEAATTISGSLGMAKAAWQNLLVGIADGKQDLGQLVSNFVESFRIAAGNITKVVPDLVAGVRGLIAGISPEIPGIVQEIFPALLEGAIALLGGLATALPSVLDSLMQTLGNTWTNSIWPTVQDFFKINFGVEVPDWSLIVATMTDFAQTVKGEVNTALQTLQAKFQAVSAFLTETFSPAVTEVQQLFTKVKTAIAPLVTQLADYVSGISAQFAEYVTSGDAASDATDLLKDAFELLADGVVAVVDGIFAFSDWCSAHQGTIQTIAIIIGSFAAAWLLVNGAITIWNAIAGTATAVTTGFGAAVAFLTSPVTLVTAAIGALIAIVALCVTHWDSIKAAATNAWNGIKSAWNAAATWFDTHVIQPVTDFFSKLWTDISTAASDAWAAIETAWKTVADWFDTNIVQPVTDFFSKLWTGISTAASDAWSAIKTAWEAAATWFDTNIVQPISTAIGGVVEIINGIGTAWTNLKQTLSPISTSVTVTKTVAQAKAEGASDEQIHAGLADGSYTVESNDGEVTKNATGAVFSRATIFDTRLGKQMVGEAGPEAVAPISVLQGYVADAVNNSNSAMVSLLAQILDAVQGQGNNMEEQMTRAFSSMRFDVNNREFARLVKAVT